MSKAMSPEVALAVAVIERTVGDLKHGSEGRKIKAREDTLLGGLDFWVDVVGEEYEAGETIRRELRSLASRGVRLVG